MANSAAMMWPVSIRTASALLLLALALTSCGRSNPVAPPAVSSARFTRLEVSPDTLVLPASGPWNSSALRAIPYDTAGRRMSTAGAFVTYSSFSPGIASVDYGGVVTAGTPGRAEIHVTMRIGDIEQSAVAYVLVHDGGPTPAFGGTYDLTAPITGSDPAWGIEPGSRMVAVVTIEHSLDGSNFTGRFSGYDLIAPDGSSSGSRSGWVAGVVEADGRVVLDLFLPESTSPHWHGAGRLATSTMSGTFGAGGHITGTFTAVRR